MVVDYFSRFLEVAVLKSMTSAKVIEAIHPMFFAMIFCTFLLEER